MVIPGISTSIYPFAIHIVTERLDKLYLLLASIEDLGKAHLVAEQAFSVLRQAVSSAVVELVCGLRTLVPGVAVLRFRFGVGEGVEVAVGLRSAYWVKGHAHASA